LSFLLGQCTLFVMYINHIYLWILIKDAYFCIIVSNFTLQKRIFIQKVTAALLLVLLVLGNTPKRWLHDTFANHTGCTTAATVKQDAALVDVQKPHCDCDDVVIESPFTSFTIYKLIPAVTYSGIINCTIHPQLKLAFVETATLRGPPSFC
jgi:hypothetical protein